MEGMDHGNMKMDKNKESNGMQMEGHDMSMYDLFTINGKSGDLIEPLKVKKVTRFDFDSLMLVIYHMISMFMVMILK